MKKGQASTTPSSMSPAPTASSPARKHIGSLPSQHPADWTNINGPPVAARRDSMARRAAAVATTRPANPFSGIPCPPLEQAQRLGTVADQEVLGLAVVVQHHLVVLAADAG